MSRRLGSPPSEAAYGSGYLARCWIILSELLSANRSRAAYPVVNWAGLDHSDMSDSPMPSAMLEQEAQIFGLRERVFPSTDIRSPQQTQIREFMCSYP